MLQCKYLPAHVGGVDHAKEGGEQVGSDVEDGKDADDDNDGKAGVGRFDSYFFLDLFEEAFLGEVVIEVGHHGRSQGFDLFEAHRGDLNVE